MKLAWILSLILVKFLHGRTNELYKVAVLQNLIFKGVGEIEFKIYLFIKGKPKGGVERKYKKLLKISERISDWVSQSNRQ